MTKSVYFRDPDGNRVEYFFNTTETAEEGLAMMREPDRVLTEFALEDA